MTGLTGSDIGGYLDRDDQDLTGPEIPFDPVVFARWTAIGGALRLGEAPGRPRRAPH